jgi:hypothetical protein
MTEKDLIVEDALRITTVINKHLAEENCVHKIQEIAKETLARAIPTGPGQISLNITTLN